MSAQERDSTHEIQQLRSELQLMVEAKQASMMQYMIEMMVTLMRNNGPSESSSAEGSAAERGSPRGAGPTVVRGTSAEDRAAVRGTPRGTGSTVVPQIPAAAAAGAEREEKRQQQERRLFVRMPRVMLE